jgi:hypothetical protein
MAKLSARGRKELLRIERERDVPAIRQDGTESLTTWERTTRVVMSDGKVLEKFDVRFKPDNYRPNGEFYSYGWKVAGKAKPGKTAADVVAAYMLRFNRSPEQPQTTWKIVSGGPKPVILSETRIMRAIESGESIGFCKACGASQGGCEPDARNYPCESCGAREVYGAEECLMAG